MTPHPQDNSPHLSPAISRKALAAKNQMPAEEASALEGIHASVDFLLKALAEDLDAPLPSKEPAFLEVVNDRVCLVRSLVDQLESTRNFLANFDKQFGAPQPTSSPLSNEK